METITLKAPGKIKQNKSILEQKLNVKIEIKGKQAEIEGETVEEFEARMIIEAMDFGFQLKDAIRLTDESIVFRKIPIKKFTTRKNLEEVRGRIVGTEGKTKRTVEEVSGCAIVLHENMVGIIGLAENIEEATTAITNLIKGSKQSNVYRFLERMNAAKRGTKTDLGLKHKDKSKDNEEDAEEENADADIDEILEDSEDIEEESEKD